MSTEEVWNAVSNLADVWVKCPTVQALVAQLPLLNDAQTGIPEALRNLDAGTSIVCRNPLATAMWEALAEIQPMVALDAELRTFLRSVAPIGHFLESTVGWIRSRLPLYPLIPAPQLAPSGYRCHEEYGLRLRWRKQLLQCGLQTMACPPGASFLGLPERDVQSATTSLVLALENTPEWSAYEELSAQLTGEDRTALLAARREVEERLSPTKVDQFEPIRMARRERYRIDQVNEVVQTMTGRARDFADAFEQVDDLIDLVANDVFGQAVTIGAAIDVPQIADLETDGQSIKFTNKSETPVAPGNLVSLRDPLVQDVVLIEDLSFVSDPVSGMVVSYRGRQLRGSASSALKAPA